MTIQFKEPPEWDIEKWFNTKEPLSLANLKGRVIVAFAFQMLCPGCVEHSIPQAKRVHALFANQGVTVVGFHTVFEHHTAMQPEALKAFLHEYRVDFPVGVDRSSDRSNDPIPKTMQRYQMQGTPTVLLFDRRGMLRKQKFGREQDLVLGAEIMALLREPEHEVASNTAAPKTPAVQPGNCDESGCSI